MATGMGQGAQAQPNLHPTVFPTLARWCQPANLATADCGIICRGEDGCDYVIKDGVSGGSTPLVPHCEWFCSELSEMVQIAAPVHKIIDMRNGTYAFGSRWAGGVVSPKNGHAWYDRVKTGDIPLKSVSAALSHIYAFDHFIFNEDRHEYNFIVHDQNEGFAVLANDYSRAWVNQGFPLPPIPMRPCNTVLRQRELAKLWNVVYINISEVDETLGKIRKITRGQIERIFDSHPEEWLEKSVKDAILAWWGSAEFMARIDAISAGVKSATCL